MSCRVYYQFKDDTNQEEIPFEGPEISVSALKSIIRLKNGLDGNDCDLILMNADGKIYDEIDFIPVYSSIIVMILPVRNNVLPVIRSTFSKKPNGPAPAEYKCHRCKVTGHWIQDCPGIPDKDGKLVNARSVRRPTGIPTSNLTEVDPSTPNCYLTADGRYVVNTRTYQAYLRGQAVKQPFLRGEISSSQAIADKQCAICWKVVNYSSTTPCCGRTCCIGCTRTFLFNKETTMVNRCPRCKSTVNVMYCPQEVGNETKWAHMAEEEDCIEAPKEGEDDDDDDLMNAIFGLGNKENDVDKKSSKVSGVRNRPQKTKEESLMEEERMRLSVLRDEEWRRLSMCREEEERMRLSAYREEEERMQLNACREMEERMRLNACREEEERRRLSACRDEEERKFLRMCRGEEKRTTGEEAVGRFEGGTKRSGGRDSGGCSGDKRRAPSGFTYTKEHSRSPGRRSSHRDSQRRSRHRKNSGRSSDRHVRNHVSPDRSSDRRIRNHVSPTTRRGTTSGYEHTHQDSSSRRRRTSKRR